MMITRLASLLPRWIAITSTTSVACGTRAPLTICDGVSTSRQLPQSLERLAKRAATQRRAAPIPRVSDRVSDKVWRVPKPTSVAIVECSAAGSTRSAMSRSSRGSSAAWTGAPSRNAHNTQSVEPA